MKETGIRGPAVLRRVGSIDYARSIPWGWMHLFFENVIPTLVDFWTGHFKGLDLGSKNYLTFGRRSARKLHVLFHSSLLPSSVV
ncbi:hypothetical protein V8E55_009022 [Tylopilus felleus]